MMLGIDAGAYVRMYTVDYPRMATLRASYGAKGGHHVREAALELPALVRRGEAHDHRVTPGLDEPGHLLDDSLGGTEGQPRGQLLFGDGAAPVIVIEELDGFSPCDGGLVVDVHHEMQARVGDLGLATVLGGVRADLSPPLLEDPGRSEEHTSELQSRPHLVCRLLLEKKKKTRSTLRNY